LENFTNILVSRLGVAKRDALLLPEPGVDAVEDFRLAEKERVLIGR